MEAVPSVVCASDVNCRLCTLGDTRQGWIVEAARGDGYGYGGAPLRVSGPRMQVPLLVVGEAPGQEEDASGEPFVGVSGRLLREAVAMAGVRPQDVVYTNSCRCRPPDNRTPTKDEVDTCRTWLELDIAVVQPKVILAVGKVASQALSGMDLGPDVQVRETWHPAYVKRLPRLRERFFRDIRQAAALAGVQEGPLREPGILPGGRGWDLSPTLITARGLFITEDVNEFTACDVETTGEDGGATVGWSFSYTGDGGWFVEGSDVRPGATSVLTNEWGTRKHVWLHNAKFDLPRLGIDPRQLERWDDTFLAAYILRYPELSLEALGDLLVGTKKRSYSDLMRATRVAMKAQGLKPPASIKDFSLALQYVRQEAVEYAAMDSVITSRLAQVLWPALQASPRQLAYYEDIEKPLLPILMDMEANGTLIDADALEPVARQMRVQEALSTLRIERAVGMKANPHSHDQVRDVLKGMGWLEGKKLKKTPGTGRVSTGEAQLLKLVGRETFEQLEGLDRRTQAEEFVYQTLCAREARKLKSTYVDALLNGRDATGRIHGQFNQCVTATNRLSSSNPNLQNQPSRSELGRKIRRAFVAPRGRSLLRMDFSQVEIRIFAHYTEEPVLIDAYKREEFGEEVDIHDMVRQELGLPQGKMYRDISKNGVFAMLYGVAEEKFAETVGVPQSQATEYLKKFRTRLPSLMTWQKTVRSVLESQGYLETLLGWRMYFPLYWSEERKDQQDALRSAVNAPVQGTAAGLLKRWLIAVDPFIRSRGGLLLLTVHDELLVECDPSDGLVIARACSEAVRDLGRSYGLKVPLKLGCSMGPNWADQTTELRV